MHIGLGEEAAPYLLGRQTHVLYLEALLSGGPLPMTDFRLTYDGLAGPDRTATDMP